MVLCMVLMVCFSITTAQNDLKPVTDVNTLTSKINTEMKKVSSLQSKFKQVKHIATMKSDLISNGNFFYSKSDKVCLEYTSPMEYLIVINGSKIKMDMNGKKTVYDVSSNGLMQEMVTVISSCMTGNIKTLNSKYKIEYFQNEKEYVIKVYPTDSKVKNLIYEVDLHLSKSDMCVSSMKMIEASKNAKANDIDFTEYIYTEKKLNGTIPADKFNVQK